jgi:hypothetical protein
MDKCVLEYRDALNAVKKEYFTDYEEQMKGPKYYNEPTDGFCSWNDCIDDERAFTWKQSEDKVGLDDREQTT